MKRGEGRKVEEEEEEERVKMMKKERQNDVRERKGKRIETLRGKHERRMRKVE